LAYKYLEAANKALGKDQVVTAVSEDGEIRNLLDSIDREVEELIERIENVSSSGGSKDTNIIDVSF
ncbi:MAG: hypothetical protein MJA27_11485, partial [Pseudanabaenales cyanobacterium]|nr:hypothetical protein [Pseudanabaenales cyanobacterium]